MRTGPSWSHLQHGWLPCCGQETLGSNGCTSISMVVVLTATADIFISITNRPGSGLTKGPCCHDGLEAVRQRVCSIPLLPRPTGQLSLCHSTEQAGPSSQRLPCRLGGVGAGAWPLLPCNLGLPRGQCAGTCLEIQRRSTMDSDILKAARKPWVPREGKCQLLVR